MSRVTWTVDLRKPEAGKEGPIVIREGAARSRIICVIQGNHLHERDDGRFVRSLDDDDVAAVRLILAAPRMKQILEALRVWHARMGDWRPATWEEAESLLDELAGKGEAKPKAES
jgi:hypothetical protein